MKLKFILIICISISISSNVLSQNKFKQIDSLVIEFAKNKQLSGSVLVKTNGKIIYQRGVGYANHELQVTNSPSTKFRLASITKQFTSMLVMMMVNDNKMKLDAVVNDYLPDYSENNGKIITIHQLLSHTSGMPHYESIPDFFKDKSRLSYTHKDFITMIGSLDLKTKPGVAFSYSSFGYYLLGYILETVTGKSYSSLLKERIIDPLELKNTGVDNHFNIILNRANGYNISPLGILNAEYRDMSTALATGDIYSTVGDLSIWDDALSKNTLLNEKLQSQIFKPNLNNYGYGWNISYKKTETDSVLIHQHSGSTNGFLSLITRIPETNSLIVILCNVVPAQLSLLNNQILAVLNKR